MAPAQASRNIADSGDYIGDSSLVSAAAPTRVTSVPGRRLNATGPGLGFLPDTLVLSGNDSSGVINVLCASPVARRTTTCAVLHCDKKHISLCGVRHKGSHGVSYKRSSLCFHFASSLAMTCTALQQMSKIYSLTEHIHHTGSEHMYCNAA